ncbi:MAG: hypothetical protein IPK96_17510 [Flammeovirgaceae bacterium]|nr:hypothetical protein [Flammeovirgaceae bacterium]
MAPIPPKWITENNIFQNKGDYQPLDTMLSNYHRWTYIQSSNNFYHNLGNVGTALNPIFLQAPTKNRSDSRVHLVWEVL